MFHKMFHKSKLALPLAVVALALCGCTALLRTGPVTEPDPVATTETAADTVAQAIAETDSAGFPFCSRWVAADGSLYILHPAYDPADAARCDGEIPENLAAQKRWLAQTPGAAQLDTTRFGTPGTPGTPAAGEMTAAEAAVQARALLLQSGETAAPGACTVTYYAAGYDGDGSDGAAEAARFGAGADAAFYEVIFEDEATPAPGFMPQEPAQHRYILGALTGRQPASDADPALASEAGRALRSAQGEALAAQTGATVMALRADGYTGSTEGEDSMEKTDLYPLLRAWDNGVWQLMSQHSVALLTTAAGGSGPYGADPSLPNTPAQWQPGGGVVWGLQINTLSPANYVGHGLDLQQAPQDKSAITPQAAADLAAEALAAAGVPTGGLTLTVNLLPAAHTNYTLYPVDALRSPLRYRCTVGEGWMYTPYAEVNALTGQVVYLQTGGCQTTTRAQAEAAYGGDYPALAETANAWLQGEDARALAVATARAMGYQPESYTAVVELYPDTTEAADRFAGGNVVYSFPVGEDAYCWVNLLGATQGVNWAGLSDSPAAAARYVGQTEEDYHQFTAVLDGEVE